VERADKMRGVIAVAVAGMSLAGCSSLSLDSFKPTPPAVQVQLESNPPGADARTSLGPSCRTPCSVSVPAPDSGFDVTFTLDKFLPVTVPVQVIRNSGAFNTSPPVVLDPDPVVAELQPAPLPKGTKRMRPKPKAARHAAAPASAFPDPNARPR
jgi:outer membrane murein-binding lipoprotein Lpp